MHAEAGDWLLVRTRGAGESHGRRAVVLATAADGSPPYKVRWLDTEHEALIFPDAETEIISSERQAELDREEIARLGRVQSAIVASESGR